MQTGWADLEPGWTGLDWGGAVVRRIGAPLVLVFGARQGAGTSRNRKPARDDVRLAGGVQEIDRSQ